MDTCTFSVTWRCNQNIPLIHLIIQFHESSRIKIIIPCILSHAAFSKSWCREQTAHAHTIFSSMSVIGVKNFWIMHQEQSQQTDVVVTIDLLSSLCVITVYRIVLRASCAVCFMHHYYFILIVCRPGAEQIPYIYIQ